ncbi:MAG: protein kinase [Planctomycetaceae bacterium]
MSISSDNSWQEIQSLFEQALEQSEDSRTEFLEQATQDPEVRREVAELLAAYAEGEAELDCAIQANTTTFPEHGAESAANNLEIPGYQILGEIHRGGQGIVYRAIQEGTKREVAIKFVRSGDFADSATKRRFEREVELSGGLRHSGIVRIYDSGLASGQYYYVMDYIEGSRLDEYVTQQSLTQRQILELFIPICSAINYAHQHGVIHRDLKPSNILVDSQGNPHVVDFGLAKLNDPGDDETLQVSFTGQIMGTIQYMSPEQASGQPDLIDTRSDIYSLAVILYFLLTKRLPYAVGKAFTQDLLTIQTENPLPMQGVSWEVETVVLKALSKEPTRRYQTAGEFGDDLRRFIRGESIEAKRDSVLYVLRKAVARNKTVTAALLIIATTMLVSGILGWGLYLDAEQSRQDEQKMSLKFLHERDTARQLRDESQRQRYFVEMDLAGRLLNDSGGLNRIEETVSRWNSEPDFPESLRGWEWNYLSSRIDRQLSTVNLNQTPFCARFSPNGEHIAFGDGVGFVGICSSDTATAQITKIGQHSAAVRSVSWSPDGKFLASGSIDNKVCVYDLDSKKQLWTLSHNDNVVSVEWHPTRALLASSSNDGVVKVWNTGVGKPDSSFDIGHGAQSLDWEPNGERLAVGTWGRKVYIWHSITRQVTKTLSQYSGIVTAVRWSGDGTLIATGEDNGDVKVRSTADGSILWSHHSQRPIADVAWSPDDTQIAVVGEDRTIEVWDPFNKLLIRKIDGHNDSIWSVDWSQDGNRLLTSSHDYTLKTWLVNDPHDDRIIGIPNRHPVNSIAWSPDDSKIAAATVGSPVFVFNAESMELIQKLNARVGAGRQSVSWSPNGLYVAAGGWDERVTVWEASSGNTVFELHHESNLPDDGTPNIINCVSWSPDGKRLVSSSYDGSIAVWDAEAGNLIERYDGELGNIYSVDWSPVEDDLLALSTSVSGAWLWSVGESPVNQMETERNQSRCVRWSPDGTQIAVCREDGLITIHDSKTTKILLTLSNHLGVVGAVDWHPQGDRLATASNDGTVRVWDVETGTQTIAFDRFEGPVRSVAWSHNGQMLAAAGKNGAIYIFDASKGYAPKERLLESSSTD